MFTSFKQSSNMSQSTPRAVDFLSQKVFPITGKDVKVYLENLTDFKNYFEQIFPVKYEKYFLGKHSCFIEDILERMSITFNSNG